MIGSGRNRRRYAARPALAAVLVVLAVGACTPNDGTAPTTAPTTTTPSATSPGSSATPTPTPSATPSTSLPYPADVPAAARAQDPSGAEAYVQHWVSVLNSAWTQPASGLLPPLCLAESKSCANYEATAIEFVTLRQRYSAAPVTVGSTASNGEVDGERSVILVGRREARTVINTTTGQTVETVAPATATLDFRLVWRGGRWWVSRILLVKETP